MREEHIIKTYKYRGKALVEVERGSRYMASFCRPLLSQSEAEDLAYSLTSEARIHMKQKAYPVYKLLEVCGLKPDVYISDEDILIYTANRGYKSMGQLRRGDKRATALVKQRGLEARLNQELFNDLK